MEGGTWSFGLSTSSRGYQSTLKSVPDFYVDLEKVQEDDLWAEYMCTFCGEEFDLVELCAHIDVEHPCEDLPRACPVCAVTIVMDMTEHISTQHGDIYNSLEKLKRRNVESHSTLSFLKKEQEDEYMQLPLTKLSSAVSASNMPPDPLLSFLYNVSAADKSESVQSGCSSEVTLEEKSTDEKLLERNAHPSPLSNEEHREKAKRSEFVRGLLLSTIFDDDL